MQILTYNLYKRGHANTGCQVGNSFVHSSDKADYVGNFEEPKSNFQKPQDSLRIIHILILIAVDGGITQTLVIEIKTK